MCPCVKTGCPKTWTLTRKCSDYFHCIHSYCRKEIKWFHEAMEKAFGTKMLLAGN